MAQQNDWRGMMPYIKPPLGIIPKEYWERQRLTELQAAISRYYNEYCEIPTEWIEEYNELVAKYGDKLRGDN